MKCRKCKTELDLSGAGMICPNCGYDNLVNPDNLNDVIEINSSGTGFKCPKCGSKNIKISNNLTVEKTPFNLMNSMLGCLCCGPFGSLLGLTGGQRLNNEQEKICDDCGTRFK